MNNPKRSSSLGLFLGVLISCCCATASRAAAIISASELPADVDCLEHYCIQLDFESGKMRFLDAEHSNKQTWGKAFRLTAINSGCFAVYENLAGAKGGRSMIDTGDVDDGWLTLKLYQEWTNHVKLPAKSEARSPNGVLGGGRYPDIHLDVAGGFNAIGLHFLSRHLVTLDFPERRMYLKRTSIGPLADENSDTGANFLKSLKKKGRLPGWSKEDRGEILAGFYGEVYPVSGTFDVQKKGGPAIYHYLISRLSKDSPWKLEKAWRSDQNNPTIEEYPIP